LRITRGATRTIAAADAAAITVTRSLGLANEDSAAC
jgi:hypothetical protein